MRRPTHSQLRGLFERPTQAEMLFCALLSHDTSLDSTLLMLFHPRECPNLKRLKLLVPSDRREGVRVETCKEDAKWLQAIL